MTDNRTPPPLPTPETVMQVAAARHAWGYTHHSGNKQPDPFTWPDEAQHIFDGIKTGLTTVTLPSLSGFKTIMEKAPVNMAFALISALEDGFLSLKSVSQSDQACNSLELLEGTLNCSTYALEMIRAQAENDIEERFARQLTHRVNFAEKTLKQLREFVK